MQTVSYPLKQFFTDTEQAVRSAKTESEILRNIRPWLEKLLGKDGAIPEEVFKPRVDRFAMNLLYLPRDKSFSIVGGVWAPGQTTPIHDHLTWALIGVYRGKERESLYRRVDDRSNMKFAKLEKASEKVNEPGHVTVLGHTGIHKVDNPSSDKTTYSVHVYGRDIGNTQRHTYDPVTGQIGRFVSGYCTVLNDTDPY